MRTMEGFLSEDLLQASGLDMAVHTAIDGADDFRSSQSLLSLFSQPTSSSIRAMSGQTTRPVINLSISHFAIAETPSHTLSHDSRAYHGRRQGQGSYCGPST